MSIGNDVDFCIEFLEANEWKKTEGNDKYGRKCYFFEKEEFGFRYATVRISWGLWGRMEMLVEFKTHHAFIPVDRYALFGLLYRWNQISVDYIWPMEGGEG